MKFAAADQSCSDATIKQYKGTDPHIYLYSAIKTGRPHACSRQKIWYETLTHAHGMMIDVRCRVVPLVGEVAALRAVVGS